jgi:hypothetical protein
MLGKNFAKIKQSLPKKQTQEVILYYYTNKRTLDLKKQWRETQARKMSKGRGRPTLTGSSPGVFFSYVCVFFI